MGLLALVLERVVEWVLLNVLRFGEDKVAQMKADRELERKALADAKAVADAKTAKEKEDAARKLFDGP